MTGEIPALRVRSVSKTFGTQLALDSVSFDVEHGKIHALLGENGSGKSTLIKILAGVYQGDPGGILEIEGNPVEAQSATPAQAKENRLRFVHQDPGLFQDMTIADNIAMPTGFPLQLGAINKRALHRRVRALLEAFEISARPGEKLGSLRPADQTMVAIARALERRADEAPSLLVLDEPTASLPQEEVDVLLAALRRRAAAGQGIIYVSHRIDEVLSIADTVTVLRDGKHIITRPREGLTDGSLTQYIAGRPIERLFGERATADAPEAEVVLRVDNLVGGPLRGVSFELHKGEILGVAGLLGSGRTELLRMIFAALAPDQGQVSLAGKQIRLGKRPSLSMEQGVAYVPENRALDAAFPELTVTSNLSMAQVPKYRQFGRLDSRAEKKDATASIKSFGIQPPREGAVFSTLSGGNQQKVILARWLRRRPAVLLLDEPTQGVDVGARADVYATIRQATADGMSVILVSSDFEELVHAADRVLVLQNGVIAGELPKDELDRETLTYMTYVGKEARS
jgi:ribose transport system ATP-binding protein